MADVYFVHSKTFAEIKDMLQKKKTITKEQVEKLAGTSEHAEKKDDDKMTAVDMRTIEKDHGDFDDIDEMIEKLGPRATSEAFVKAEKYFERNKKNIPEDERRKRTWREWKEEMEFDEGSETEEMADVDVDYVHSKTLAEIKELLEKGKTVTKEHVEKLAGTSEHMEKKDEDEMIPVDMRSIHKVHADFHEMVEKLGPRATCEAFVKAEEELGKNKKDIPENERRKRTWGEWKEEMDFDEGSETEIMAEYVHSKTLAEIKELLKNGKTITKEHVEKLAGTSEHAEKKDDDKMTAVDMRTIEKDHGDFDDVDEMVKKLGAKATCEAYVKAAEEFEKNKQDFPEDERRQLTWGDWKEEEMADVHYVHSKTLAEIKELLKKQKTVTKEHVEKLAGTSEHAEKKDDDKMIPVDARSIEKDHGDFDSVDEMVEKLGPRATCEAFVKAEQYLEKNKKDIPEEMRRKRTWREWKDEMDMGREDDSESQDGSPTHKRSRSG